jgi:tRNA 2-thiouridine synthesizing protein A
VNETTPAIVLDASGLTCPRPVLMLADGLSDRQAGDTVLLKATDPTSKVDVPVWCRRHRHTLVAVGEQDGTFLFTVTRGH